MSSERAAAMRQVVVNSAADIRVERVPWPPAPAEGDVLVRSRLVGIGGSDTHACAGKHPFMPLPYRPGHEVVGVVAAVGSGVTDLAQGDRVVLEPNLVCGKCRQCLDGRYNICRNLAVFGCQTVGAMADEFVVAADRLHRLPDGLSFELAALIEPLATPVHAGAGDGGGADVVLDCVARESSMTQAIELVDKGGTVMVVGIAAGPTTIPLHVVQDREISVVGSLMYTRADVRRAVDLLAGGAVTAAELVTATYPLDRAAEAFAAAADPEQVKVLVSVS